ncbi:MAG: hypothetical protein HN509_01050 [Halobacteriovoraceae bacterium]|jgi:hypothetical protein|nr:hypothetical protein [Halobacteriovoraceae bacterium]
MKTYFLTVLLIFAPVLRAEKFQGKHLEFEVPYNWKCQRKALEWFCKPNSPTEKRDAIIILSTGLKRPEESFEELKKLISKKRSYQTPNGKKFSSIPKYTKFVTLNQHRWVDSFHLGGEIPNFYTRYLLTIKNKVSFSFSYSVRKEKIAKYQSSIEKSVKSLVLKN